MEQKLEKAEELKENLTSWQTLFIQAKSQNEAAVKHLAPTNGHSSK